MYFRDGDLLPENQEPLIITAAPYGPAWRPDDYAGEIPVSWDEQVQAAVDCYEAGASLLHIHVRDPKTGKISKNFQEYADQIGRLREAVPDMVLQVGGSISFAPEGDETAKWQSYDTRHMLAEIDPRPDQVTVAIGTSQYDITSMLTMDDVAGTHMADEHVIWKSAYAPANSRPTATRRTIADRVRGMPSIATGSTPTDRNSPRPACPASTNTAPGAAHNAPRAASGHSHTSRGVRVVDCTAPRSAFVRSLRRSGRYRCRRGSRDAVDRAARSSPSPR